MQQNSEVARLLAQINREYEAAQNGLSGLAQGVGQHRFMTKRMEQIAELHTQLRDLVGDEAMELIACHVEGGQESDDRELEAIADELTATREYAINPEFKENLHRELMQQFVERKERTGFAL